MTIAFLTGLKTSLMRREAFQLRRHSSSPRNDQKTIFVGRRMKATADNASDSARLSWSWSSQSGEPARAVVRVSFLSSISKDDLLPEFFPFALVFHLEVSSDRGRGQ